MCAVRLGQKFSHEVSHKVNIPRRLRRAFPSGDYTKVVFRAVEFPFFGRMVINRKRKSQLYHKKVQASRSNKISCSQK